MEALQAALVSLRDVNPSSSLPEDWQGPLEQWRGLKHDEDGTLKEL
jgi:hypothetical protein